LRGKNKRKRKFEERSKLLLELKLSGNILRTGFRLLEEMIYKPTR
jgi:hypothetical protein